MVHAQDTAAMLALMNEVPVAPGDAVLVPAGLPHAIGEGVFVLELQEPTDFSILLEWQGFDLDGRRDGHLGLGFDVALECVDRSAWSDRTLLELSSRRPAPGAPSGVELLFPPAADPFFRAERLAPSSRIALEAGYSVITTLAGRGELATQRGGDLAVQRGDVVLVPHGAGAAAIGGPVEVVRCRPPDPADAGAVA
jgi:mannose-6-phosphate isomerase